MTLGPLQQLLAGLDSSFSGGSGVISGEPVWVCALKIALDSCVSGGSGGCKHRAV